MPHEPRMSTAAPPRTKGYTTYASIPLEFLEAEDDYFESGYESDEEDEYP